MEENKMLGVFGVFIYLDNILDVQSRFKNNTTTVHFNMDAVKVLLVL